MKLFSLKYLAHIVAGAVRRLSPMIPNDKTYLSLIYFLEHCRPLHLKNPRRFTEKIQYLKIYDHNPDYVGWVDKLEAKKRAAVILGEEHVIPTLAVWNDANQIDFDSLPERFVLKSTNGSGGSVWICEDREKFDFEACRINLSRQQNKSSFSRYREWPYKLIKARIFAEPFMIDGTGSDLTDYKFYCFGGVPMYCQVIANRRSGETIDFFDMDWNHQEFYGLNPACRPAASRPASPICLRQMGEAARILSKGDTFVRIDLYEIDGKVYFGEKTYYPASGIGVFTPDEWDFKLGDLIKLTDANK